MNPVPVASGVLVVDKPRGPTSHDVVSRARRILKTREVGHAGTLDPMATGVLVLAIGEATKLVPYLTAHDKAYVATVRFGETTRSLDADSPITESLAPSDSLREGLARIARGERDEAIERALEQERARVSQIPPQVSAIKVDGRPSHARVRKGETVELLPREVSVRSLIATGARMEPPELDLSIECAKGYYVRSLARDLASALGTVGHLVALRRTRSGPFEQSDAVPLDDDLGTHLIPLREAAAKALPSASLTADGSVRTGHGKPLSEADFVAPPSNGVYALVDPEGSLIAIARIDEGVGRVLRGFRPRP